MRVEIERKFLVVGSGWKKLAVRSARIRQAYLTAEDRASVRVRIKNDESATLTIKPRQPSMRRLEMELPIPVADAEELFSLRSGAIVEKTRYVVPAAPGAEWEVDVFAGDNAGLAVAEIELRDEDSRVDLPSWIGAEV